MKFIIQGKTYDADLAVSKVSLQTLYVLKTKYGLGMKTVAAKAREFQNFASPIDILEDGEAFNCLRAILWITRTHYGEHITLDEAVDFPMDEFFWAPDGDDDAEETPDPKGSEDSSPGADLPEEMGPQST